MKYLQYKIVDKRNCKTQICDQSFISHPLFQIPTSNLLFYFNFNKYVHFLIFNCFDIHCSVKDATKKDKI